MRLSRFWLLLLLALGLVIVVVPMAVRHALAPGYADVDLKSLGYFLFDGRSGVDADIPARWRKLDGKRVALQGFMYDPKSAGPKTQCFELVYDLITHTGIHGPPLVQERVFATVPHGTVQLFSNEVEVEGTLHVSVTNPTGDMVSSVFQLDVDRVRLIPRAGVLASITGLIEMSALLWLPALIVLCIRVWNQRKRRHAVGRLCSICGYDLRASGNRCPECGSLVNDAVRLSPMIGSSLGAS